MNEKFEFKSAASGAIALDELQGIVECFVAGIGNKDSVGDIVVTGAFAKSLTRRKPRVVWAHSWNDPIGKVLEMYEVPAGDPRLPAKMRNAGIGGLYAKVQFNLQSEKGKEAFASVAFFGEEQEWSIGYKTINGAFDTAQQANVLREVELYEVSPVLHGANQLTGTISVKSESKNHMMPIIAGMPMMGEQPQQPRMIVVAAPQQEQEQDEPFNIFAEGLAQPLEAEKVQKIQTELSERTGSKVDIVEATDSFIVFRRTTTDGKVSMYRVGYHTPDGYNTFMFGKPEAYAGSDNKPEVQQQIEVKPADASMVPMQPQQMPYRDDDQDEMNTMLGGQVGVGKSAYAHLIEIPQSLMIKAKSMLQPVFNYHNLSTTDSDNGIIVNGSISAQAIDALQNAVKAIGQTIGQSVGNLRTLSQSFNPFAIDGDNDGFAQDGTTFQRPYIPIKKPDMDLPEVGGKKRNSSELLDKPTIRTGKKPEKDPSLLSGQERQEALAAGDLQPRTMDDISFLANRRPENEGIAKYWDMSEEGLRAEGQKLVAARRGQTGSDREKTDAELFKISHEFSRRDAYKNQFGKEFVPPKKTESTGRETFDYRDLEATDEMIRPAGREFTGYNPFIEKEKEKQRALAQWAEAISEYEKGRSKRGFSSRGDVTPEQQDRIDTSRRRGSDIASGRAQVLADNLKNLSDEDKDYIRENGIVSFLLQDGNGPLTSEWGGENLWSDRIGDLLPEGDWSTDSKLQSDAEDIFASYEEGFYGQIDKEFADLVNPADLETEKSRWDGLSANEQDSILEQGRDMERGLASRYDLFGNEVDDSAAVEERVNKKRVRELQEEFGWDRDEAEAALNNWDELDGVDADEFDREAGGDINAAIYNAWDTAQTNRENSRGFRSRGETASEGQRPPRTAVAMQMDPKNSKLARQIDYDPQNGDLTVYYRDGKKETFNDVPYDRVRKAGTDDKPDALISALQREQKKPQSRSGFASRGEGNGPWGSNMSLDPDDPELSDGYIEDYVHDYVFEGGNFDFEDLVKYNRRKTVSDEELQKLYDDYLSDDTKISDEAADTIERTFFNEIVDDRYDAMLEQYLSRFDYRDEDDGFRSRGASLTDKPTPVEELEDFKNFLDREYGDYFMDYTQMDDEELKKTLMKRYAMTRSEANATTRQIRKHENKLDDLTDAMVDAEEVDGFASRMPNDGERILQRGNRDFLSDEFSPSEYRMAMSGLDKVRKGDGKVSPQEEAAIRKLANLYKMRPTIKPNERFAINEVLNNVNSYANLRGSGFASRGDRLDVPGKNNDLGRWLPEDVQEFLDSNDDLLGELDEQYYLDNPGSPRPGARDHSSEAMIEDLMANPEKYGFAKDFRKEAIEALKANGADRDEAERVADYWIENDGIHDEYLKQADGDSLYAMALAYDNWLDASLDDYNERQRGFGSGYEPSGGSRSMDPAYAREYEGDEYERIFDEETLEMISGEPLEDLIEFNDREKGPFSEEELTKLFEENNFEAILDGLRDQYIDRNFSNISDNAAWRYDERGFGSRGDATPEMRPSSELTDKEKAEVKKKLTELANDNSLSGRELFEILTGQFKPSDDELGAFVREYDLEGPFNRMATEDSYFASFAEALRDGNWDAVDAIVKDTDPNDFDVAFRAIPELHPDFADFGDAGDMGFASRSYRTNPNGTPSDGYVVMSDGQSEIRFAAEDGDGIYDATRDGYSIVRTVGGGGGGGRRYPESTATYGGGGLSLEERKEIIDTLNGSSDEFIQKLLGDFKTRGRLSDKQWSVLKNRADREKKKNAAKKPSGFVDSRRTGGTIAPGARPVVSAGKESIISPTAEQIADADGLEKLVNDARFNGQTLRFNYNGKNREVFPVQTFKNPKTGKVNMVGQDAEGVKKTFTIDKMSPFNEASGFASRGSSQDIELDAYGFGPAFDINKNDDWQMSRFDEIDRQSQQDFIAELEAEDYFSDGDYDDADKLSLAADEWNGRGLETRERYTDEMLGELYELENIAETFTNTERNGTDFEGSAFAYVEELIKNPMSSDFSDYEEARKTMDSIRTSLRRDVIDREESGGDDESGFASRGGSGSRTVEDFENLGYKYGASFFEDTDLYERASELGKAKGELTTAIDEAENMLDALDEDSPEWERLFNAQQEMSFKLWEIEDMMEEMVTEKDRLDDAQGLAATLTGEANDLVETRRGITRPSAEDLDELSFEDANYEYTNLMRDITYLVDENSLSVDWNEEKQSEIEKALRDGDYEKAEDMLYDVTQEIWDTADDIYRTAEAEYDDYPFLDEDNGFASRGSSRFDTVETPNSSAIEAVHYDRNTRELHVAFKPGQTGGDARYYTYSGVPADYFDNEISGSNSIGRVINDVKKNYDVEVTNPRTVDAINGRGEVAPTREKLSLSNWKPGVGDEEIFTTTGDSGIKYEVGKEYGLGDTYYAVGYRETTGPDGERKIERVMDFEGLDSLDVAQSYSRMQENMEQRNSGRASESSRSSIQDIDVRRSAALYESYYDPNAEELVVTFKDKDGNAAGSYIYEGVTADEANELASASSKGKVINRLKASKSVRRAGADDRMTRTPGAADEVGAGGYEAQVDSHWDKIGPEEQRSYFARAVDSAINAGSGTSAEEITADAKQRAFDDRQIAMMEMQAEELGMGYRTVDVGSSAALNRVQYDPSKRELRVEYRGRDGKGTGEFYVYKNVPQSVVDDIEASDSRGATLRRVRDDFEFTTESAIPESAFYSMGDAGDMGERSNPKITNRTNANGFYLDENGRATNYNKRSYTTADIQKVNGRRNGRDGFASRGSINESSTGQRIVPSRMHSDDREALAEITDPEERKQRIDSLIEFYGPRIFAKPSKPKRKKIVLTQDENGYWVGPDGKPSDFNFSDDGFASRGGTSKLDRGYPYSIDVEKPLETEPAIAIGFIRVNSYDNLDVPEYETSPHISPWKSLSETRKMIYGDKIRDRNREYFDRMRRSGASSSEINDEIGKLHDEEAKAELISLERTLKMAKEDFYESARRRLEKANPSMSQKEIDDMLVDLGLSENDFDKLFAKNMDAFELASVATDLEKKRRDIVAISTPKTGGDRPKVDPLSILGGYSDGDVFGLTPRGFASRGASGSKKKTKEEVYAEMTKQLIDALSESEKLGKWQLPWRRMGMPENGTSGHKYSGSNWFFLTAMADIKGYNSNKWATYDQWQGIGGQVRKGEKATSIFVPIFMKGKEKADGTEEKGRISFISRSVFNLDQIDGMPADFDKKEILPESERVADLEKTISEIPAVIKNGGDEAYFSPSEDFIQLPLFENFKDARAYYSTAAHELMHWTGGKDRLGRENMNRFGTPEYAYEELVAEIASAMFMAAHNIEPNIQENHGPYLASWIKKLKDDPTALERAMKDAQSAVNYVLDISPNAKSKFSNGEKAVFENPDIAVPTEAVVAVEGFASRGDWPTPGGYEPGEFDMRTALSQIGRGNLMAISGTRANKRNNEMVLPVNRNQQVIVGYDGGSDTYFVRAEQIITSGKDKGKTRVLGQWDNVYADELGETAYQASLKPSMLSDDNKVVWAQAFDHPQTGSLLDENGQVYEGGFASGADSMDPDELDAMDWAYDAAQDYLMEQEDMMPEGPSQEDGFASRMNLSTPEKNEIIAIARRMNTSFTRSVVEQYDRNGELSDRQWDALNRMTLRGNRGGFPSRGEDKRPRTPKARWSPEDRQRYADGDRLRSNKRPGKRREGPSASEYGFSSRGEAIDMIPSDIFIGDDGAGRSWGFEPIIRRAARKFGGTENMSDDQLASELGVPVEVAKKMRKQGARTRDIYLLDNLRIQVGGGRDLWGANNDPLFYYDQSGNPILDAANIPDVEDLAPDAPGARAPRAASRREYLDARPVLEEIGISETASQYSIMKNNNDIFSEKTWRRILAQGITRDEANTLLKAKKSKMTADGIYGEKQPAKRTVGRTDSLPLADVFGNQAFDSARGRRGFPQQVVDAISEITGRKPSISTVKKLINDPRSSSATARRAPFSLSPIELNQLLEKLGISTEEFDKFRSE